MKDEISEDKLYELGFIKTNDSGIDVYELLYNIKDFYVINDFISEGKENVKYIKIIVIKTKYNYSIGGTNMIHKRIEKMNEIIPYIIENIQDLTITNIKLKINESIKQH